MLVSAAGACARAFAATGASMRAATICGLRNKVETLHIAVIDWHAAANKIAFPLTILTPRVGNIGPDKPLTH